MVKRALAKMGMQLSSGAQLREGVLMHTMPPRLSRSAISCFRRCSVRPAAAKATWMGIRPACDVTSRGGSETQTGGG
jgi:hypothetical protein